MSREPSMEDILSSIRKVIAREDAPGPAPRLARGAPDVDPDILELDDESFDDAAAETPIAAAADADELVAADAAQAARRSLDALSAAIIAPEGARAPVPATSGSRSLDDVVTEALRPMLKQWLDANLPPLVETMVAKEIARITGRRI